jgi:hypothetical protein
MRSPKKPPRVSMCLALVFALGAVLPDGARADARAREYFRRGQNAY